MNRTNSGCACCPYYSNGQCGNVNMCYGAIGTGIKEVVNMSSVKDYYNNLSNEEKAGLRELVEKDYEKLSFIWELGFNLEEGFFTFHTINKELDNIPKHGEVYELEGDIFADFWTETCEKKEAMQTGIRMIKEYVTKKIQKFAEKAGE